MGHWDYENIGASATPENRKIIQKIFEYIGYAPRPEYVQDAEKSRFKDPDVYCCKYSACHESSGEIKESFWGIDEDDLLNLLNALFPKTNVYIHASEGSNTSDTWENHDVIYDTSDMTRYSFDSYCNDYGEGPIGDRTAKARFALDTPNEKYLNALINLSAADENDELTALLQDLAQRLKDGLVVYTDDPSDKREIGIEYDIEDNVEGDEYDDYYDEDEDEEDEEYDDDF